MKKRIVTIILTTLLVLMLTTTSFAGTWHKADFSKDNLGTGFGRESHYITKAVVTSGNPSIRFYVYGGSSKSTIKVEMQRKDYIPSEGRWDFKTVSTTTKNLHSSGYTYISFSDTSVGFTNNECRFKITPYASSVNISGYVHYFTN